jgi:RimJ/RimL family protein N-acetyltransferase
VALRLRELERPDLAAVNRWRNDPEVIRFLGANFIFISPEIDQRWYDSYLTARDRTVRLAMEDSESNRVIGCVYLTDIHRVNRSAEFAILIGEKEYWGRGHGTEASRRVLAHAFDDLNLHRIYLSVLADNLRAIRLYEKLGFRQEGRQREAIYKEGAYRDVVLMAVLEQEYRRAVDETGIQRNQGPIL